MFKKLRKLEEISRRSVLPLIPSEKLESKALNRSELELKATLQSLKKGGLTSELPPGHEGLAVRNAGARLRPKPNFLHRELHAGRRRLTT